jgi:ADP-ribose pyrophosphatase YjhB (NUDIX family)
MKYCTRCGNALRRRWIEGKERDVCPVCGWVHYQNPLPVVAAVIASNRKKQVLLIKRRIPPGRGKWALPGGFVEKDESPPQAILREIREEIGVEGKVEGLIGVYQGKTRLYGNAVIIGYKVASLSRSFLPGKEVEEIRFFPSSQLPSLAFTSHGRVLLDFHRTFGSPIPTVDGIIEKDGGIVLIERKNPPYGWALPGGFVDYGESLEEAVKREVKEETNLEVQNLRQFRSYSDPARDPRFHTISTVFIAEGKGKLEAKDDAQKTDVFKEGRLPARLAFDHGEILEDYFRAKRGTFARNVRS